MQNSPISLERWMPNQCDSDLQDVLTKIVDAGKVISEKIRRATLEPLYSSFLKSLAENEMSNEPLPDINVHGEVIKTLDRLSNEEFINNLKKSKHVSAMISEEEVSVIKTSHMDGKYFVTFDPLDGSSNIDANINIGSIFGIYMSINENYLQAGKEMICAGYLLYGPATMLIISLNKSVNGFCLDDISETFILTHPNITVPPQTDIYSVNEGNFETWKKPVANLITQFKSTKKPYSLRYIGSMVADVHRTLLYGGLFMYPASHSSPDGKLRYLYEVAPMAHIINNAGGQSLIDGNTHALDYRPLSIHQRVPIFLGSIENMCVVSAFLKKIPF
jgi:fructose-1,6-bisphosphatase I